MDMIWSANASSTNIRQLLSLQPDLRMCNPEVCNFVEALTNTFMNFLFAIFAQ